MIRASSTPEGAAASSATATDIPLVPPSPYKPGARPARQRPSILPSLFANKMSMLQAADGESVKDREAVRKVEHMMGRHAIPFEPRATSAQTTSGTGTASGASSALTSTTTLTTATTPRASERSESVVSVMMGEEARARTESMQWTLFFSVKCEQCEADEANARAVIEADEERALLAEEMRFLDGRQRYLAETLTEEKAQQLAMLQQDKRVREERRATQLRLIETEVTRASLERRMSEALRRRIDMVYPQYLSERRAIEEEEEEDLRFVFQWHAKNRPLGPGCFIKGPEEDPRIRYGSLVKRRPTAAQAKRMASAKERSRLYCQKLRAHSSTALVEVDSDTEAERTYADEGRRRLQAEKARLHEHIRRTRAVQYLVDAEREARMQIQYDESEAYQPLAAFGVDHLYEVRAANHAQERERTRTLALANQAADAAEDRDEALRVRIRAQLAREGHESVAQAAQDATPTEV